MPSHQEQRCQTTALRSTFKTVSGFHHDYCPSPRGRLTGFSWGWLSRWRCRGRVKLSPAGSQNSPWKSKTSPKGFSNGWTEVPRRLKMSFAQCISQLWPITIKKYKKQLSKVLIETQIEYHHSILLTLWWKQWVAGFLFFISFFPLERFPLL